MISQTQETKIENLRIHSNAKAKVIRCVGAIHKDRKVEPTLSETINIICDHYLAAVKAVA